MSGGTYEGKVESSTLRLLRNLEASVNAPRGRIRDAMARVPRAPFLPAPARGSAHLDIPIPIVKDDNSVRSVCSQPSAIVAMLELLDAQPGQAVLEIGGGSGFNAALIGEIVGPSGRVDSLEIDGELVNRANETIRSLGIRNTELIHGNGINGGKNPPYDRIIVSAGICNIAEAWLEQLAAGGRLACPIVVGPGIQKGVGFCKTGKVLQSFRVVDCSYMPIVGTEWPTAMLTNGEGVWIECSSSLDIKWRDVAEWLKASKPSPAPIGMLRRSEILSGFDLWLALHANDKCCVATSLSDRPESALIPELFCYAGDVATTSCTRGLVTKRGIALLRGSSEVAYDSPITLTIEGGGDEVVASQLTDLISTWNAAGRPDLKQWGLTVSAHHNVGPGRDSRAVAIKRGTNSFLWSMRV